MVNAMPAGMRPPFRIHAGVDDQRHAVHVNNFASTHAHVWQEPAVLRGAFHLLFLQAWT